ncbi:MAG: WecB/TagA/CpsF family glycosyltransferase [Candidatus Omnitrophota bacterium]
MVTPDGAPVAWLCRLKGSPEVRRTYGPDLMLNLCQETGIKHFFYGGTQKVLEKLEINLKKRYPHINIVGCYAPGFNSQAKVESSVIIDMINSTQADIVWVALGSPKQDFWMHYNRPILNAPVLVGVGAAFDFISGTKPQAPRWMQRCYLEWMFRLCCEPGRLWRRYLIGNSLFIFYTLRDLFKKDK